MVTEKLVENREGIAEKLIENTDRLIEKLIEKATRNGDKLTENRIAILRLIAGNPYISQSELADSIGISITAIGNNIKAMRNKYLRRVGPDKGGGMGNNRIECKQGIITIKSDPPAVLTGC